MSHLLRVSLVLVILLVLAVTLLVASLGYQTVQSLPIKLGTSGGDLKDRTATYCCSGTLGALVTKNGVNYILSNAHVLARSGQAAIGEDVSQPGLVDTKCGTTTYHVVADLSAEKLGGTSNVDAAIAQVRPAMVTSTGAILGIGVPSKTPISPAVGMAVSKAGRTTQLTCSKIAATNVTVSVQYETQCGGGTKFTKTYYNQIYINSSKFSAAGDSGSLIVRTGSAQPVGLLYAGSSTSTVGNRIGDVQKAFGVSFVGGGNHSVTCPTSSASTSTTTQTTAQEVDAPGPPPQAMLRATQVKEAHTSQLMSIAGVQGVGVGADDLDSSKPTVVVIVEKGVFRGRIPAFLDGVKTKVIETDKIRAFGWNEPDRSDNSCKVK